MKRESGRGRGRGRERESDRESLRSIWKSCLADWELVKSKGSPGGLLEGQTDSMGPTGGD